MVGLIVSLKRRVERVEQNTGSMLKQGEEEQMKHWTSPKEYESQINGRLTVLTKPGDQKHQKLS